MSNDFLAVKSPLGCPAKNIPEVLVKTAFLPEEEGYCVLQCIVNSRRHVCGGGLFDHLSLKKTGESSIRTIGFQAGLVVSADTQACIL